MKETAAGRPKYRPSASKPLEKLSEEQAVALDAFASAEGGDLRRCLETRLRRIATDRFQLAEYFLRRARQIRQRGKPGLSRDIERDAISRAYYAMYHAVRAFHLARRRYDCDDHRKLPQEVRDFGRGWFAVSNKLNRWRLRRNEADYSPYYPVSPARDAREILRAAEQVVRFCRRQFDSMEAAGEADHV